MMRPFINLMDSKNYALGVLIFLLLPMAYAAAGKSSPKMVPDSETANLMDTSSFFLNTNTLSSLKAGDGLTFGTEEKVRKGKIVTKDVPLSLLIFNTGSTTIIVYYTATSTFLTGDGAQIAIDDINLDSFLYIFGNMSSDNSVMLATKIVTAKKVKFWTLRN